MNIGLSSIKYEDLISDAALLSIAAMLNAFSKKEEEGGAGIRFDLIDQVRRSNSLEALADAIFAAQREAKSYNLSKEKQIHIPAQEEIERILKLASSSPQNLRLVRSLLASYALSYYVHLKHQEV
ncbi:MAG: hypothetical protein QXL52_04845 [Nitrososphaerales archaeon]